VNRADVKKGARVMFIGPQGVAPLFEEAQHRLKGKSGTIVYGMSEDIWCYPDDPASDMVWVAFDEDRLPRRQVSTAWLERAGE